MKKIAFNNAVEGLRGWLILFIVLYHYTARYTFYGDAFSDWSTGLSIGKPIGVSGFLIISGFMMFRSLQKSPPIKISTYIARKLQRLYIPYAISLVFLFLVNAAMPFLNHPQNVDFITNLLFIRIFFKSSLIDGAHWYLYALAQLYIIVPLVYTGYTKRSKSLLLVGILVAAYMLYTHVLAINKSFLLCFCGGFSLALHNKKVSIGLYSLLGIMSSITLKCPYVLLVFGTVFLVVHDFKAAKKVISLLFCNKAAIHVGTYSYMWYLIHQSLGYAVIHAMKYKINDYCVIICTMAFTYLCAMALHKCSMKISTYIK